MQSNILRPNLCLNAQIFFWNFTYTFAQNSLQSINFLFYENSYQNLMATVLCISFGRQLNNYSGVCQITIVSCVSVVEIGIKMATVAILCLLLLERFLASDMDVFTEPVLVGLRALEKTALRYTQSKLFFMQAFKMRC